MRAFAVAWPEAVFVQWPIAQMEAGPIVQAVLAPIPDTPPTIVQRPVAQLPWRHHTILLDKLAIPRRPALVCRQSRGARLVR